MFPLPFGSGAFAVYVASFIGAIILPICAHAAQSNEDNSDISQIIRPGLIENWWARDAAEQSKNEKHSVHIRITLPQVPIEEQFVLSSVSIIGTPLENKEETLQLFAPQVGKLVTKEDLETVTREISRLNRKTNGALSYAYISKCDVETGAVEITLGPGLITNFAIEGAPNHLKQRILKTSEKYENDLTYEALQQFGEEVSEIVQTSVDISVEPELQRPSEALIRVQIRASSFSVEVGMNNYAPTFVGRDRLYTELGFENTITNGDEFEVNFGATLDFEQLRIFSAKYSVPIGRKGAELSVSGGTFRLRPGVDFLRALGFQISNNFIAVDVSHPVETNIVDNLKISAGLSRRQYITEFSVRPSTKDVLAIASVGVEFEFIAPLIGSNEWEFDYWRSVDLFGASSAANEQASRPDLGPGQSAFTYKLEQTHQLRESIDLIFSVEQQFGNGPIVGGRQCQYGGGPFGMGYDPIELAGDSCFMASATIEATPGFLQHDRFDTTVFVAADHGSIRLKGPTSINQIGNTPTSARLESIAFGAELSWKNRFTVGFEIGVPLDESRISFFEKKPRYLFSLESEF